MREDLENRIDDYFREGLDNLNVIPPVDVWNNIADQLPVKKKGRKAFLWIAVAASVSLFAAISGWNYLNRGNVDKTEQVTQIAANRSTEIKSNNSDVINSGAYSNPEEKTSKVGADANMPVESIGNNVKVPSPSNAVNKPVKPEIIESNQTASESGILIAKSEKSAYKPEATGLNSKVTAAGDNFNLLAAIPLRSLDSPGTYGKIETGIIAIKIDTAPVYENIYAYQEIDQTKEKLSRWAVGGQMAPLYSYRNVSEVNVPGVSKASMNSVENAVVTYASGVNVDYNATSRLTFQTGIHYMKMGQEIDNIGSLTHPKAARMAQTNKNLVVENATAPVALNSTGTIITASTEQLYALGSQTFDNTEYSVGNMAAAPADLSRKDIEQSFEFIEVPFLAKYKIIDKKINVHLLGGMSTHVLVNNTAKLVSDNNIVDYGKTADVETFNYSSSVGFGVVYNLSKRLLFSVEPTFKYYLNSFNSNGDIKLHPYAFGVYSGVSFKF